MKIIPKKILVFLLALLIVCSISGCANTAVDSASTSDTNAGQETTAGAESGTDIQAEFDSFLERQFREAATEDSITLNFTLKHPENYGINRIEPTYGEYSAEAFRKNDEDNKKALEELNGFKYSELTEEQQLCYDILKYKLELSLEFEGFDYYGNVLSPTIGLQAQLPFILAEYHFYTEDDVSDYLALLAKMDSYYSDILQFEKEKSEMGLFMSDFAVDAVIKQCKEFTESTEDNFLIDSFNVRIEELNIPEEKKTAYREENKNKVLNDVIPAYGNLVDGLKQLKGTGTNDMGLCYFENGREYYEILARNSTGSVKSVDEMIDALDEEIMTSFYTIITILQAYPELFDYFVAPDFGTDDPAKIMESLKYKMEDYYPMGADVRYTLKYIDKSMEDSSSPAFYLIPPIDDYMSNIIYVNGGKSGNGSLYTILAHEGFPGHLYQSTYFYSKNPNPIRLVLGFDGYVEGWAVYVENNSFYYADFPYMKEELSVALRADSVLSLLLHARADMGVNYEGWSAAELLDYLSYIGFDEEQMAKSMYERVIEEPANYLKYAIGYLEFEELFTYARDAAGPTFSLIDFHQCILDVGPAPFPIVKEAVDRYVRQ